MESLTLPFVQIIIQLLGLPGLIFIIWHFDNKRLDKQREQYAAEQQLLRDAYVLEHKQDREQTNLVMSRYREDISAIKSLYQNNAHLVGDYDKAYLRMEKIAGDMMSVVSLNAQAYTQLTDAIKNNLFCPQTRDLMGKNR